MFLKSSAWIWKGIQNLYDLNGDLYSWMIPWKDTEHFPSTGSSYNSNWLFVSGILVLLLPGINAKLVMADGLCLTPGGWISPSYTFQKNNCRKEAGHNNQQLSSRGKIAATFHSGMAVLQWYHTGKVVLYL